MRVFEYIQHLITLGVVVAVFYFLVKVFGVEDVVVTALAILFVDKYSKDDN